MVMTAEGTPPAQVIVIRTMVSPLLKAILALVAGPGSTFRIS
ncbi:hypothetical protein OHA72_50905 [Dactylosporangium sp. NBC_01737]|nr:hypothetical protein OHA72_50905 [Dactylosporangium sp. NBC_01737]